jgi:hypothetical protein
MVGKGTSGYANPTAYVRNYVSSQPTVTSYSFATSSPPHWSNPPNSWVGYTSPIGCEPKVTIPDSKGTEFGASSAGSSRIPVSNCRVVGANPNRSFGWDQSVKTHCPQVFVPHHHYDAHHYDHAPPIEVGMPHYGPPKGGAKLSSEWPRQWTSSSMSPPAGAWYTTVPLSPR